MKIASTSSNEDASSVVARPFRRVVVASGGAGGRANRGGSRRVSIKEQVPRPQSAVILGLPPSLPATTDHLRRSHTEGYRTVTPPHISARSGKQFAPFIHTSKAAKPEFSRRNDHQPWTVKQIPPNPPYPLERTHEILRHTSPSTIANRIASCLRDQSIGAVYDNENAACIAETSDLTKFYVRLFRCGDEEESDGAVLVEVQRRRGSCPTFHDAARVILAAARGSPTDGRTDNNVMSSKPRSLPASLTDRAGEFGCASKRCCSQENTRDAEDDIKQSMVLADLECVNCLLHKERLDAHLLALEGLRFLTDAQSTGVCTATAVAKAILSDDAAAGIRDAVLSLVVNGSLDTNESRSPHDCDIDVNFGHALREHALAVLANSIGQLSRSGSKDELPVVLSESNELLSVLADDITNVQKKPNDAYEASRCLNKLLEASDAAKLDAKAQGVLTLITAMQRSGGCRHAKMERELNAAAESLSHVV
mmetsp:Transcript_35933/g.78069  ORF Transcript_35933/g.78069 Transcript_35933/m.78069 type:complete len:480 (+) Transcript_35933:142-1581(+)